MLVLILLPQQTNKTQEQHRAGLGEGYAGQGGQEGFGDEAGGKEAEVKWMFKGNWEVEVLDEVGSKVSRMVMLLRMKY